MASFACDAPELEQFEAVAPTAAAIGAGDVDLRKAAPLAAKDGLVAAETGSGSLCSAFVNITASCVGTGILALPSVFARTGIVLGILMVVLAGWLTAASCLLLLGLMHETKAKRYPDMLRACLGPRVAAAAHALIVTNIFLILVAYINVFVNTSSHFFRRVGGDGSALGNRFVVAGLGVGICTLLCAPKKVSMLKYTSFAAVCCILFVYGVVQGTWISNGMPTHRTVEPARGSIVLLPCMAAILTTFGCQASLIYIDLDLTDHAKGRLPYVLVLSLCCFCTLLYATGGAMGYLLFGDDVEANVLTQLPLSPFASVAQALIAAVQLFKVPLLMHGFMDLTAGRLKIGKSVMQAYGPRAAFCVVALLAMSAVAMSINLRRIMAITGGFTFITLWFMLPALAEWQHFGEESGRIAQKVLSRFCATVAPVFALATMTVIVVFWDQS